MVAENISDTIFQWNNLPLADGQKIWFSVTGRSVDNKLTGSALSPHSLKVLIRKPDAALVKIYPNPVSEIITMEPAFQMDNPPVRILKSGGGLIREFKINFLSDFIDVRNLPRGVYFL